MKTLSALSSLAILTLHAHAAAAPLEVFVSSPPQKTIVERVGGSHVNVTALIGPGQDPHHFSITPSQTVALKKARVYFATGLPFELSQLDKISAASKKIELVNIARGIELQELGDHGHDHGDHEGHDHHDHAEDPHIWLSPPLLKTQAETVADILSKLDPDNAADYEKNRAAFAAELDALHARLTKQLAPHKGRHFFVYHPAFGYFARTYGLNQESVEVGGNKPTPKQLLALIKLARHEKAAAVFVQPGFDKTAATTLAKEIGCGVTDLDPLSADLLRNIQMIADALTVTFTASGE